MSGLAFITENVIKIVGAFLIIGLVGYFAVSKVSVVREKMSGVLGHFEYVSTESATLTIISEPKFGAGYNTNGLLELATHNFVNYKLEISPKSCLSFSPDSNLYVITNTTTQTINIPVYFRYNSGCRDIVYTVTLSLFSQRAGKYIPVLRKIIMPDINSTNLASAYPDSGSVTVYASDLKDLVASKKLTDYQDHLSSLEQRGIIVVSNSNFPLTLTVSATGVDKVLVTSNKMTEVKTYPTTFNITLEQSEVMIILPEKSKSITPYFSHVTININFIGAKIPLSNVNMNIMPAQGVTGVAFANQTMFIPIAKRNNKFTIGIHLTTSKDYVYDIFGFKTFSLVPDLNVLSDKISTDWQIISYDNGNNYWVATYGYKPDIDRYGLSREYITEELMKTGSGFKGSNIHYFNYDLYVVQYFNTDSNLRIFANSLQNGANTNIITATVSQLISNFKDFIQIFGYNNWPVGRAFLIQAPTFIVGFNRDMYGVDSASAKVSVGDYTYNIWKLPDTDNSIKQYWYIPLGWFTNTLNYPAGTKAYTFVNGKSVVPELLDSAVKAGYYTIKSQTGQLLTENDSRLILYWGDSGLKATTDAFSVGQHAQCSLLSEIKNFDLPKQRHFGCYQKTPDKKDIKIKKIGNEYFVEVPVKILVAYHPDFPDMTTGVSGCHCQGCGGVMMEREDMISLLAPWTSYWCGGHCCLCGRNGWEGKRANDLLYFEVNYKVTIDVKVSNGFATLDYQYNINVHQGMWLPLLEPRWDSTYLFTIARS